MARALTWRELPVTRAQLAKIWACGRRELGLTDAEIRELVWLVAGRESLRDLTRWEAAEVIDEMEKRLNRLPPKLSSRQLWQIRRFERALGWHEDPSRLRGFLRKFAGVEGPHWLDYERAGKVIEALKSMAARRNSRDRDGEGGTAG